jgi:hypothetical protein
MTALQAEPTLHERRISHRLDARGDAGLLEPLIALRGLVVGGRHRIESLYAVGGEGAVYLVRDLRDPLGTVNVGKVALLPYHRPSQLDGRLVRKQRGHLRTEAEYLSSSRSRFLPGYRCVLDFGNPLLDPARGGPFAQPELMLLMEKLPGLDLDRWLARVHRSDIPLPIVRRTLDRVSVMILQGLVDLDERGFLYADLRPGNVRILGRPERMIRLLDAGSLVTARDPAERFPHVPAYLPEEAFDDLAAGRTVRPTTEIQSVMAGRTLYEVATGCVPLAGQPVNLARLGDSHVSEPVARVIETLCSGGAGHVRESLRALEKSAKRRVFGGNDPLKARQARHVAPRPETDDTPLEPAVTVERGAPRRGLAESVASAFSAFAAWIARLLGRGDDDCGVRPARAVAFRRPCSRTPTPLPPGPGRGTCSAAPAGPGRRSPPSSPWLCAGGSTESRASPSTGACRPTSSPSRRPRPRPRR